MRAWVNVMRVGVACCGELVMDRRDFLKTTGAAAAVVAGASGAAAQGTEGDATGGQSQSAPMVLAGIRRLTFSADYAFGAGLGPERLARRIEVATDGRFRIETAPGHLHADLTYGIASRHAAQHRGFAYFGGLPFSQGLNVSDQYTWLAVGGAEMLWNELAAELGFKPLLAGHTGVSAGIWAGARLEQVSDLKGAMLHATGLAADAVRALGATPVEITPRELKAALAAGRIRAAEWLGPLAAVSPDLQPVAQRLYEPGFHRGGTILSLDVRKPLWDGMSASDRAIFEACAAQEYHVSLADAHAHSLITSQVQAPARWPVKIALSEGLADALDLALSDIVEGIAAADPQGRRIHDSYQAFRGLLGEDLIA
jgi:TRAP-type mannitol/chloroaromatic compound transport system substrate-binding protein